MRRAAAAGRVLRWRTIRPRSRRRCASSPRSACSPTRPPATASPASRSTAPIPTRSRRRLRGPSSARAAGGGRRSSSSSRCACAATRTTTTCCISARIRSRAGTYPPLAEHGLCRSRAVRVLVGARSDSGVRGAPAGRGAHRQRGARSPEVGMRGHRRVRGAGGDRGARGRRRGRRAKACSRASRRASGSRSWTRRSACTSTPIRRLPPLERLDAAAPVRSHGQHVPRSRDARRRRCAPRRPDGVRLRRGRRRRATATRFCCSGRCWRSSAIASSTRRWPRGPCSACASAPRSPVSGRSARCSSTISSPPASTSS